MTNKEIGKEFSINYSVVSKADYFEKVGVNDKKAVYYVRPGGDIPPELFPKVGEN